MTARCWRWRGCRTARWPAPGRLASYVYAATAAPPSRSSTSLGGESDLVGLARVSTDAQDARLSKTP